MRVLYKMNKIFLILKTVNSSYLISIAKYDNVLC